MPPRAPVGDTAWRRWLSAGRRVPRGGAGTRGRVPGAGAARAPRVPARSPVLCLTGGAHAVTYAHPRLSGRGTAAGWPAFRDRASLCGPARTCTRQALGISGDSAMLVEQIVSQNSEILSFSIKRKHQRFVAWFSGPNNERANRKELDPHARVFCPVGPPYLPKKT